MYYACFKITNEIKDIFAEIFEMSAKNKREN